MQIAHFSKTFTKDLHGSPGDIFFNELYIPYFEFMPCIHMLSSENTIYCSFSFNILL